MKYFIIIVLMFSNLTFAQNWFETPIPVNIAVSGYDVADGDRIELHTNKFGNSVTILMDGNLSFYRFDVSGVVKYSNPNWISNVEYANITGDESLIYVVYKKDNEIKVQYSTNGGSEWQSIPNVPFSQQASFIDAAFTSDFGLCVVWASSGQIKYNRYFDEAWENTFTVSNNPTEFLPRLLIDNSTSKAYVMFTKGGVYGKYRHCYLPNSQWSDILDGFDVQYGTATGFVVDDEYIFIYYNYSYYTDNFLKRVKRRLTDNVQMSDYFFDGDNYTYYIESTKTNNNIAFATYWYNFSVGEGEELPGLYAVNYPGNGVYNHETIYEDILLLQFNDIIRLSSISNDVHVIWQDNLSYPYLRYSYRDMAPLIPPNFAGTNYNNRPKLTWDKIEPDIEYFEVWRRFIASGYPGGWNLLTTTTSTSFIDYDIWLGGSSVGWVLYEIRSKDIGNHFSSYTNVVAFRFSGLNKTGSEVVPLDFVLNNNHPNPFNPATQITYSLAQNADVTLKVYDMLGTEVAELVDETQAAGSYKINFNSEALSSGVYIYRITATNNGKILFTDSKQMILMK